MKKHEALNTKHAEISKARDLGNATEQTKGYNFDRIQEIQPYDKKYDV